MVPLHTGVESGLLGASDMEHEFSNECRAGVTDVAVARRLPPSWPLPSFPAGASIGKATGCVSIDRLFVL